MGKIVTLPELRRTREACRQSGQKVVFTNGCFDILHKGHIEYLTKAKALGEILVVGINTDDSTRRIKGKKRPIVEQNDRAAIVANLLPVDYVCLFDEDTPDALIRAIVPDVLVKGADWKVNDIVGKDVVEQAGGVVSTIQLTPGLSTSQIIDRIRERYC